MKWIRTIRRPKPEVLETTRGREGQVLAPARKALAAAALLVAAAGVARAQEPQLLTLDRAIEIALDGNRTVATAELDVEKADDRLAASRTKLFPSISVYAVASQNLTPINFNFKQGVFGTFPGIGPVPSVDTSISTPRQPTFTIIGEVSQPLSQIPRIKLGIERSKLDVELAREEAAAKRKELVASVKSAYYAILEAQSEIESTNESIKMYAELDRVTDDYVIQQVVLRSDSLDVKAQLARAEYDASTLVDKLAAAKERLNLLLGRDVGTDFRVSPTPEYSLYETDLVAARTRALDLRPDVRQARLKVEMAGYDRRIKKAEMLPDVSLTFSHTSLLNYDSLVPRQVATLGVTVSWEVFDWGRKRRELSEKDHAREQALLALREAEATVVADVNDKYRKLGQTQRLLRVARLRVEAKREEVRVTTARYKARVALYKDALEAQNALAAANTEYQQGLLSYWTAKAEFERAIGGE